MCPNMKFEFEQEFNLYFLYFAIKRTSVTNNLPNCRTTRDYDLFNCEKNAFVLIW